MLTHVVDVCCLLTHVDAFCLQGTTDNNVRLGQKFRIRFSRVTQFRSFAWCPKQCQGFSLYTRHITCSVDGRGGFISGNVENGGCSSVLMISIFHVDGERTISGHTSEFLTIIHVCDGYLLTAAQHGDSANSANLPILGEKKGHHEKVAQDDPSETNQWRRRPVDFLLRRPEDLRRLFPELLRLRRYLPPDGGGPMGPA